MRVTTRYLKRFKPCYETMTLTLPDRISIAAVSGLIILLLGLALAGCSFTRMSEQVISQCEPSKVEVSYKVKRVSAECK